MRNYWKEKGGTGCKIPEKVWSVINISTDCVNENMT